jgi:hypothetical protein
VPGVGEYVAPDADGPWFEVRLVVHTPFEADCDAEAYAVEVDARRVLGSTVGPER